MSRGHAETPDIANAASGLLGCDAVHPYDADAAYRAAREWADLLLAENQQLQDEDKKRGEWVESYRKEATAAFHERDEAMAENQRLREDCPICGHKWRQHDPEDGRCDSHSSEGIGVCECGRDMAWMNGKIAALSREALAGDTE